MNTQIEMFYQKRKKYRSGQMLIFITALLIGFGTYNTTLYILDRE